MTPKQYMINEELQRRLDVLKTLLPAYNERHCQ